MVHARWRRGRQGHSDTISRPAIIRVTAAQTIPHLGPTMQGRVWSGHAQCRRPCRHSGIRRLCRRAFGDCCGGWRKRMTRYHVWDDNKGVATRPWKPYAPPAVVNCMSVHMPEPAATRDRLIMRRPTGHGPRDQGEGIGEGAERGLGPLCRIRQNGETGDWSGELAYEAARTARARRCRVARGPARSRSTTPKAKRECRMGNPWVGARVW